jgi:hypothetical protein
VKVTIDIDCTPEEARSFLGLPDVKPMQERLMAEAEERMMANLRAMAPEEVLKSWLPASLAGWEQMQQLFARMAAKRD